MHEAKTPETRDPRPETSAPGPRAASPGPSFFVAAGIFLSRIIGLVRERVFAHYFGNSPAAGAFKAALRIPNFLQNLFGEGVLSASFIPVYARLLAEKDEQLANRVAGAVGALLALVTALLVALGVVFAPLLVDVIAPGFEGETRALTIQIVRILFPGIGLLVMGAWTLGILNSHRRFFIPYVAPVLWSAAMIATMIFFGGTSQPRLAMFLAWGTVVGCALQLGVQLPFVFRSAPSIRFALDAKLAHVREVVRNFIPVLFSRGVVQISAIVDEMIASILGTAAVAGMSYAQTVYMLPISLFAMSVAAAELPAMSSETGTGDEVSAKLRERVMGGQRQIAFFVVPTLVAFLTIGDLLVAALFQTGHFGSNDSRYVWYILIGWTIGLLGVTLARLYSSAFYALRDTRTPFRIAIVRVIVGALLGVMFAIPLRDPLIELAKSIGVPLPPVEGGEIVYGAVALTMAAGIVAWIEYLLLKRALRHRIGPTPMPLDFRGKVWTSALLAAAAAIAARLGAPPFHPIVTGIIVAAAFGIVYLAAVALLRVPESRRLLRR